MGDIRVIISIGKRTAFNIREKDATLLDVSSMIAQLELVKMGLVTRLAKGANLKRSNI